MGSRIELRAVEPGTEAAVWRERIQAWAESGLAQIEFCRQEGLSMHEFRRYRSRLMCSPGEPRAKRSRQTQSPPDFVEVTINPGTEIAASRPTLEVRVSGGRSIGVWPGFDAETLQRLLACLEGRS